MKAYKAFKRDLTCRDFQYKEGETYEINEPPILCEKGFHFCKDLVLTLKYYPVINSITENRYAEVEILGEVKFETARHKGVTNKIKIVRILSDQEVLKLVDINHNSGDYNSGHSNSGDYNSGHSNSGDYNSGISNSGDYNSGLWNSGNWNSGDNNSGDNNSGNRNSGRYNSGNWNSCDRETGFFNTEQSEVIRVFNKPCKKGVWDKAIKPDFIFFRFDANLTYKENWKMAYEKTSKKDVDLLKALPNFDSDVFEQLTGIRVPD